MQNDTTYNIDLGPDESFLLPTFTSSVSLTRPRPAPVWIRAQQAVALLREEGVRLSDQTLYNMGRDGRLSVRRNGPRGTEFDRNEILALAEERRP